MRRARESLHKKSGDGVSSRTTKSLYFPVNHVITPEPMGVSCSKPCVIIWEVSENGQRVRMYRLTAAGRKQLRSERSRWEQFANAITAIMSERAEGES